MNKTIFLFALLSFLFVDRSDSCAGWFSGSEEETDVLTPKEQEWVRWRSKDKVSSVVVTDNRMACNGIIKSASGHSYLSVQLVGADADKRAGQRINAGYIPVGISGATATALIDDVPQPKGFASVVGNSIKIVMLDKSFAQAKKLSVVVGIKGGNTLKEEYDLKLYKKISDTIRSCP